MFQILLRLGDKISTNDCPSCKTSICKEKISVSTRYDSDWLPLLTGANGRTLPCQHILCVLCFRMVLDD